jgi:nucleoside-diphosphate-sugar epimerase
MSVFVIGGTGFIGHRLVRLLASRGQKVTCMDINPVAHSFADLGDRVTTVRGDVTQFDDVMAAMSAAKPERVVNLSYFIGSHHAPRVAMKLNVLGMDNCFEAARLLGVKHTMYASSLAVNGMQKHYGDRPVTEEDDVHGEYQYAKHKIMNEWQAQDYTEKFGMLITGIRPANVTGPDKVRGSVDHVNVITEPARGNAVKFPFKDAMRCPIHVDEVAEAFSRVLMSEKPQHDQPGRDRRNRARLPAAGEDRLRQGDRRPRDLGQPHDRERPPGAGVRHAVPAIPRARAADHQRHPQGQRPAAAQPDRMMEASSSGALSIG